MQIHRLAFTEAEIIDRLAGQGRAHISIDYSTYVNVNTPCRFVDAEFGEFWTWPTSVLHLGTGHPKRAHQATSKRKTIPLAVVRQRLKDTFGETLVMDDTTYVSSTSPAKFTDIIFGSFWTTPSKVLRSHGHPMRGAAAVAKAKEYTREEAEQRVSDRWGDEIVLLDYNGVNSKAKFRHVEFGEWSTTYLNVVRGHSHPLAGIRAQKASMMQRYGVEHPSQSAELFKRVVKGNTSSVILTHWKTGEELGCTASYEYAIVSALNSKREDFDWQIVFDVGVIDGKPRKYHCDLYLKERDLYVEIKGIMRGIGQKKWDAFHAKHTNSELWRLPEVEAFCGLSYRQFSDRFKAAKRNRAA